LEDVERSNPINIDENPSKSNSTFPRGIITLLGLIVIAALTYVFTKKTSDSSSEQNPIAEIFTPYPNLVTTRSIQNVDALKANAFLSYDLEKYEEAENYFKQYFEATQDSIALFYIANSALARGEYKTAKAYLDKIENKKYANQHDWMIIIIDHLEGKNVQSNLNKYIEVHGANKETDKLSELIKN